MTGQGGWPLTAFLDTRRRPVLRRHLLPARGAPGDAELPDGHGGGHGRLGDPARARSREAPGNVREQLGAHRPDRADGRGAIEPERRRRRGARPARWRPTCATAASAARRSSRRRRRSSCCWRGASPTSCEVTLDAMAHGGIYDQLGGGFARYSVDERLARPPLREDALRQRAARPRLPPRLPRARATSATGAVATRDPRLGAARDARARRAASTRRSTPTPRARRAASTSGTRTRSARRSATRASTRRRSSRSSPAGASARPATSRAGTSCTCRSAPGADRPGALRRGAARAATSAARSASGPASTTSASAPGTR